MPRIVISKTQREWDVINERLSEIGRKNFRGFLKSRIFQLSKDYSRSKKIIEDCKKGHSKVQPILSKEEMEFLSSLSKETGTPIATIINIIILEPILYSKP